MKNKKSAFTQAEILTVVVILGIVALITIPSVIDSTQKRLQETTKRKAEYLVSQIALQLQAECPRHRCTDSRDVAAHLRDLLPKSNSELSFSLEDEQIKVTINGIRKLEAEYTLDSNGSFLCLGDGCCEEADAEEAH